MALAVTRLDVAAPFLANALLVLLGALLTDFVVSRVETAFIGWKNEVNVEKALDCPECKKPVTVRIDTAALIFDPGQTSKASVWAIDASQILGLFLGPLLGLILLAPPWSGALSLLYIAGILGCIAGFAWFVTRVKVDRYWARGFWGFTPVSIAGLVVSIMAAAAAAAIGP